jgi:hypothetical protein
VVGGAACSAKSGAARISSVRPSSPPSMQAKMSRPSGARISSTIWPPGARRTQRAPTSSAAQMCPSASSAQPSGPNCSWASQATGAARLSGSSGTPFGTDTPERPYGSSASRSTADATPGTVSAAEISVGDVPLRGRRRRPLPPHRVSPRARRLSRGQRPGPVAVQRGHRRNQGRASGNYRHGRAPTAPGRFVLTRAPPGRSERPHEMDQGFRRSSQVGVWGIGSETLARRAKRQPPLVS